MTVCRELGYIGAKFMSGGSYFQVNNLRVLTINPFKDVHCRSLVPINTQKNLSEIWHHFWLQMMVNSGLEKKYFEIQQWPSEIPANLPGQFSLPGQQQLWRPSWNLKIFFSKPLFTIILRQKWCQISVRIFCVVPGSKNLHWEPLPRISRYESIRIGSTKGQSKWFNEQNQLNLGEIFGKNLFHWIGERQSKKKTSLKDWIN